MNCDPATLMAAACGYCAFTRKLALAAEAVDLCTPSFPYTYIAEEEAGAPIYDEQGNLIIGENPNQI